MFILIGIYGLFNSMSADINTRDIMAILIVIRGPIH